MYAQKAKPSDLLMPPTRFLPSPLRSIQWLKWLLCASAVALAGCATQPRPTADAGDATEHVLRDSYLQSTQSDPLGAWLNSNDSLAINYPRSESYGLSPAPKTLVGTAMKFLGVQYRYGGTTPSQGFDCSGLVAYAAEKSLGLKLPRTASGQAHTGIAVSKSKLKRGDLVFFNTLGRRFSHVGIYLGNHKFIHAPRTGAAIRVEDMDIAYWRKRYNGARRINPHGATARR